MKRNRNVKVSKWKIVVSVIVLCLLAVALIFADQIEVKIGYNQAKAKHQTSKDSIESSAYYVSYIDVGQGSSSFVKLPDGKTLLIDGGDIEYGETVGKFLRNHNVSTIDYLVATHADSDHIGGLNYVLENFEIKSIYRPLQISGTNGSENVFQASDYEDLADLYDFLQTSTGGRSKVCKITTSVYARFIKNIYTETYSDNGIEKQSSVTVFYDGLVIGGDNYEIEFFAPLKREISGDFVLVSDYATKTDGYATQGFGASSTSSNDNSAIFTVTCFDDKFLFMGDSRYTESGSTKTGFSEFEFINSLKDSEKLELAKVDVLLLAHHGSKYSTSTELLNIVLPRFVVVSAGENNKYGHPASETLERVAQTTSLEQDYLLQTYINGDIEFASIDGTLQYSLDKAEVKQKLNISFRLLCVIIAGSVISFVLSIRPRRQRKSRR